MYTRHTVIDTQLGEVTLIASAAAIAGLYFPHHWYKPAEETFGERVPAQDDLLLLEAANQVSAYLAGNRTAFDLPIATAGDEFQEKVWALLARIPFGQTTTYGTLAEDLGDKSLARSVGQAVGRNPLCVIIPCHRVVGSEGALTGYAGGLARKKFLLGVEEPAPVAAGRLF
jgi:methylated-DNA-[protein]-cysteine S-methyltransferase